ncbi:MAG: Type 1 glutamine amidotransferase-like domain-containing protein [bacterium]
MKLFLASSFDKTISLFIERLPNINKRQKVLFISNASDHCEGDKWWVESDRNAFIENGFDLSEIDLRDISKDDLSLQLNNSDILHICGGSVFYLLSLIREKELESIIKDAILKDKLIYTGTSAGSMIVANSVKSAFIEPEEKDFVKIIPDFNGIDLVNFLIVPHCNNSDFIKDNIDTARYLPELKTPLIMLYDNQAVWVEDRKIEILEKT